MLQKFTRRATFGLMMALASTSVVVAQEVTQPQAYFVDLLYLNDGKTAVDANAYFDLVLPVIADHGLNRITPGFEVINVMNGDIEPNLVNIWSVSDMQNTFPDIFSDDAYKQHIPLRNSIFDMGRSHMFLLQSTE